MRFIFGMIVGALLTIGGAYVADFRVDPRQGGCMVNWTVVGEKVSELIGLSCAGSESLHPTVHRAALGPGAAPTHLDQSRKTAPAAASAPAGPRIRFARLGFGRDLVLWRLLNPRAGLLLGSWLLLRYRLLLGSLRARARSLRCRRRHHVDPGHEGRAAPMMAAMARISSACRKLARCGASIATVRPM